MKLKDCGSQYPTAKKGPYRCRLLKIRGADVHRTVCTDSHHYRAIAEGGGTTPLLWEQVHTPPQISQEHLMIS